MSLVNEVGAVGDSAKPDKQVAGNFNGAVVYTVPEGRVFRGFVYNTSSTTTCGMFGVSFQVPQNQRFELVGVAGSSLSGGATQAIFLGVESDA
jgi:hypothetical protein